MNTIKDVIAFLQTLPQDAKLSLNTCESDDPDDWYHLQDFHNQYSIITTTKICGDKKEESTLVVLEM